MKNKLTGAVKIHGEIFTDSSTTGGCKTKASNVNLYKVGSLLQHLANVDVLHAKKMYLFSALIM